jgi:hypothetical protein
MRHRFPEAEEMGRTTSILLAIPDASIANTFLAPAWNEVESQEL